MITTVRARQRRRTETPNATMTTLASPTLGPTSGLSMWRVEMTAGAQGPRHVFDSEQVWTVLEGEATVAVEDQVAEVAAGDTIVLPARAERQISAKTAARLLVCGHGDAVARIPDDDTPRGTPPWIA
jgi:quercetin dioxygenase-like cupin family protein